MSCVKDNYYSLSVKSDSEPFSFTTLTNWTSMNLHLQCEPRCKCFWVDSKVSSAGFIQNNQVGVIVEHQWKIFLQ